MHGLHGATGTLKYNYRVPGWLSTLKTPWWPWILTSTVSFPPLALSASYQGPSTSSEHTHPGASQISTLWSSFSNVFLKRQHQPRSNSPDSNVPLQMSLRNSISILPPRDHVTNNNLGSWSPSSGKEIRTIASSTSWVRVQCTYRDESGVFEFILLIKYLINDIQ